MEQQDVGRRRAEGVGLERKKILDFEAQMLFVFFFSRGERRTGEEGGEGRRRREDRGGRRLNRRRAEGEGCD